MNLFNKKGEVGNILQQQMFYVAELIIGALLILGTIHLVSNQITDAQSKSISNDLALIIETISYQTNDLYYNYLIPEGVTIININEEYIEVEIKNKKASKTNLNTLKGTKIDRNSFLDPKIIPIFYDSKEKKIYFEKTNTSCNNLNTLPEDTKLKIITNGNTQEKTLISQLETLLMMSSPKLYIIDANNVIDANNIDTNNIIELEFNTEQNNIHIILPEHEDFETTNCELNKTLNNLKELKQINYTITRHEDNKIIIKPATYDEIKQEPEKLEEYAKIINYAITRGIK